MGVLSKAKKKIEALKKKRKAQKVLDKQAEEAYKRAYRKELKKASIHEAKKSARSEARKKARGSRKGAFQRFIDYSAKVSKNMETSPLFSDSKSVTRKKVAKKKQKKQKKRKKGKKPRKVVVYY